MEYQVVYSWTIDHISWICPKCEHNNESKDSNDECLVCSECGFERETGFRELGYCDCEIENFTYEEE